MSLSVLRVRLVHGFKDALKKYPIPVNMAVYATFYTAAELSQQTLHRYFQAQPSDYDFKNAVKIAFVGSTLYAPTLYHWYRYLDRILPGNTIKIVLRKVAKDQLIMTPFLIAMFYTSFGIIDGKDDIFEELRMKFWKTFFANQMFWIPAQILNFTYMAPRFRVVYVASASFIWINVVCFIKREKDSNVSPLNTTENEKENK